MEREPISSLDLMERAARALTRQFTELFPQDVRVVVFAGHGNNGGDALAVSRMLLERGYKTETWLFNTQNRLSPDCEKNRDRLLNMKHKAVFHEVKDEFDPPQLTEDCVVVDGLFGSGLNKPLTGGFASLVKYINHSPSRVVSIDMPSGLMAEDNTYNVRSNIIKANFTFTLQHKKLSFFFAENQQFLGEVRVLDIQLSHLGEEAIKSRYHIQSQEDIVQRLKLRHAFSHKGEMGNALLVAGSYSMAGAAVLASRATLRAGVGKVTVLTPEANRQILQISVPEAVLLVDKNETIFTEPVDTTPFNALGIGSAMGQNEQSAIAMITQIRRSEVPVVIDADAINILASHRAWLQQLPSGVILTPHIGEFERLAANRFTDSYERLCKAQDLAERLQAFLLLKGHFSALCLPSGGVVFNPTGNAGMATAGSGDVLMGLITGLLARGYQREDACRIGMYLHGLAGDMAMEEVGQESLVASDIVSFLPKALKYLYSLKSK